jgi:hypothetical protein
MNTGNGWAEKCGVFRCLAVAGFLDDANSIVRLADTFLTSGEKSSHWSGEESMGHLPRLKNRSG